MLVVSYLLGQKHYPVKYPVKSIVFYFAAALAIYFISLYIPETGRFLHYTINTVLMLAFIVIVTFSEGLFKRFLKRAKG